jgi:hypothetical protein
MMVVKNKATKSETNWERVRAFKEGDAIPYEPEDGPYDPNDAEAARAWLAQADLIPAARSCAEEGAARKKLRQRSWSRCASRPK